MRNKTKVYQERDVEALDEAGGYFSLHMDAMTREELHGKFEIAAELAQRDAEIAKLREELNAANGEIINLEEKARRYYTADGDYFLVGSAEEVVEMRIKAAQSLAATKA